MGGLLRGGELDEDSAYSILEYTATDAKVFMTNVLLVISQLSDSD